jgi:hypothetical protein
MKKSSVILSVSFLMISALFLSCEKNEKKIDCTGILTGRPPVPVVIELQDNLGRDLLNPATPGHYDTTEIKTLNTPKVHVLNVGNNRYPGNTDRIRLYMFLNSSTTSINLKLSNTVEDNVAGVFYNEPDGCTVIERVTNFTYNGMAYTQIFDHYFIIKK